MGDDSQYDLLARPIWYALTGAHIGLGVVGDGVARYDPLVSPFVATRDDSSEQLVALAPMIDSGAQVVFLQAHLPALPPGFSFISRRTGVQMVYAADPPPAPHVLDIVPLSRGDAPDMLSLATLTAPGPFAARTSEIGRFWGVRRQSKLVAMAGERLRVGKWTEVSGICTHPDHRGQGLAAALTAHVIREILARGERPFLHSYADNAGAIQLYELLGFRFSRMMEAVALKRL